MTQPIDQPNPIPPDNLEQQEQAAQSELTLQQVNDKVDNLLTLITTLNEKFDAFAASQADSASKLDQVLTNSGSATLG